MGAHSIIGPSSAERWMSCPGSVELFNLLQIDQPNLLPTDEEDYQKEGTALHEAVAELIKDGRDAWELVGETVHGVVLDGEMTDAIQVALDTMRPLIVPHAEVYVEHRISAANLHPDAFGTLDFGVRADSLVNIVDCKFGKGVVVEVAENPQLMYYAYGLIKDWDDIRRVVFRIVQPRAYHPDGSVRRWETRADYIHEWAMTVLQPAMLRLQRDRSLAAGPWCRFCPAKLVCPLLTGLFEVACNSNDKTLHHVNDAVLGQMWNLTKAVKHYITAVEKEVLKRLMAGSAVPGTKLVPKRANRVWSPGAEDDLVLELGDDAYEPKALRSPAEVEKLGSTGKSLVKRLAHTPDTGLTVASEDDAKPAVTIRKPSQVFADYIISEE